LRRALVAVRRVWRERHSQHRVGRGGELRCRVFAEFRSNKRRDRCEIALQQALKMRGQRGLGRVERRTPSEQVVEQRAKTPHIAARVGVASARLLRAHVGERAHRSFGRRGDGRVGDRGDSEVDHLRHTVGSDQHIARLEIAVDDAGAMRVLHCFGDRRDEQDALADAELSLVGEARDGLGMGHEFHDEIGELLRYRPGLGC